MLRLTPVIMLPELVSPLVLWPTSVGGELILLHFVAVAIGVAYKTCQVVWGMMVGCVIFYGPLVFDLL